MRYVRWNPNTRKWEVCSEELAEITQYLTKLNGKPTWVTIPE